MTDSNPSGKVGAQLRGRGERIAHGGSIGDASRTPGETDNVDAGIARKVDLEQERALGNDVDPRTLNRDRVDNENPNSPVVPNSGRLDADNDSGSKDLTSIQGVQTGGAAAADSPSGS
jgi:hypothetical protein